MNARYAVDDAQLATAAAMPTAILLATDAVAATAGARLARMATAMRRRFVADPAHVEYLPGHRRRFVAAWKIVSEYGVILRADVRSDDDGATITGRVDGRVVALSYGGETDALTSGINQALDQLAVCG